MASRSVILISLFIVFLYQSLETRGFESGTAPVMNTSYVKRAPEPLRVSGSGSHALLNFHNRGCCIRRQGPYVSLPPYVRSQDQYEKFRSSLDQHIRL